MIHVMMAMALVGLFFAFFPSTAAYRTGLCLISLTWALETLRRRRKANQRTVEEKRTSSGARAAEDANVGTSANASTATNTGTVANAGTAASASPTRKTVTSILILSLVGAGIGLVRMPTEASTTNQTAPPRRFIPDPHYLPQSQRFLEPFPKSVVEGVVQRFSSYPAPIA